MILLLLALLLLAPSVSSAQVQVVYNPYEEVDWSTTLRCQSQHHDHIDVGSAASKNDTAGYCAITHIGLVGYHSRCRASTGQEWSDLGEPNPDVGFHDAWFDERRWPPENFGAPAIPGAFTSLKFWLPGDETVGLGGGHNYTFGLDWRNGIYMESTGCTNCAPSCCNLDGVTPGDCAGAAIPGCSVNSLDSCAPVSNGTIAAWQYTGTQELIDKAEALGGHVALAHSSATALVGLEGLEIFNNLSALTDQGNGNPASTPMAGTLISSFVDAWDTHNDANGGHTWGIAANDRYGASLGTGGAGPCSSPSPNCNGGAVMAAADLDRGKLEVMLTSYDLEAYEDAYTRGAFFAVVENVTTKQLYPRVTDLLIGDAITWTIDMSVTTRWVTDGGVLLETDVGSTTPSLNKSDIPVGSTWVRAEFDDLAGRVSFSQPFSLASPGSIGKTRGATP